MISNPTYSAKQPATDKRTRLTSYNICRFNQPITQMGLVFEVAAAMHCLVWVVLGNVLQPAVPFMLLVGYDVATILGLLPQKPDDLLSMSRTEH